MKVLVADDSLASRLVLKAAVEDLGHDVILASDGREAWNRFRTEGADTVISDWLMPEIEGPELCRLIRDWEGPYTYFILFTALDDKDHAVEGMRAGADDYLPKPVDQHDLTLRLIAAQRVSALHRQLRQTLDRREGMLRLARRMASEGDGERVLDELVREAAGMLGGTVASFCRWDQMRWLLVPVRRFPEAIRNPPAIRLGVGPEGRAVEHRQPVVFNRYQDECAGDPGGPEPGIEAVVATPLLHEGRLLGALSVATDDPHRQFGHEDVQVLELLAGLAAGALVGREQSRLEGVLLAARTMQHELNNKLALTYGYSELLSRDARLPEELRTAASEAHRGAAEASNLLAELQRVVQVRETYWGPFAGSTLDLRAA